MRDRRLVVIGGGAAGHRIAHLMREAMDVMLIDPKTYFEVPMALPRLLADPDSLAARMDYQAFLPGVRLAQGKAVGLSDHDVTVDTGRAREVVAFDYAVIATGSRYVDPLIKAEVPQDDGRRRQIIEAHRRLRDAGNVVVAGGGPVGVEITAELRETFPGLHVTLVHDGAALLESAPGRFGDWAERTLVEVGANVLLRDRVSAPGVGEQPTDGCVRTRNGRLLPADMVIWAAGTTPNTGFVRDSWPDAVNANGHLKTDEYLRLEGHPRIFVAGDVTDLPEGRLAMVASLHASHIVANLHRAAKRSRAPSPVLKRYAPKVPGKGLGKLMIVTLGRRDGLTSLPVGQFRWPTLARKLKSGDMFVAAARRGVGLK